MLLNSRAIVISSLKYGESSIISKVFTEKEGLISLISSSRKGKKQNQKLYFQPLSPIQLVFYFKESQHIHRVKEVSFTYESSSLSDDVIKSSLRFFLSELLSKVIREEGQNLDVFNFLWHKVKELSQLDKGLSNFHIDFLYELSHQLGIGPNMATNGSYFDLREAQFVPSKPFHEEFLEKREAELLKTYFCLKNQISQTEKKKLLNFLILYYRCQIGGFEKLKSQEILAVVFS